MKKPMRRSSITREFPVTDIVAVYCYEPYKTPSTPYYENHPFWQILYVRGGNVNIMTPDGIRTIQSGQLVFRAPGMNTCMIYPSAPIDLLIIDFECKSDKMKLFEGKILKLFGEEITTLYDLVKTGAKVFKPIELNEPEGGQRLKDGTDPLVLQFIGISLERLLIMLYARLTGVALISNEQQKVNTFHGEQTIAHDLVNYLKENLYRPLSIDDIAARFDMSPNALMKLFKKETGDSIIHYFNTLKINEASLLIRTSAMNFTEISDILGFSSVNYFSRLFKKQLGITPSEFSRIVSKKDR